MVQSDPMETALPVIAALNLQGISHKSVLKATVPLSTERAHFLDVARQEWNKDGAEARSAWEGAMRVLEQCEEKNIHAISFLDEERYPGRLKTLRRTLPAAGKSSDTRPAVIYVRGNIRALHHNSPVVAIVGTRTPTHQGAKDSWELGRYCARNRIPVVSGLALGCDQYGHEGCLNEEGTAIAVLAHGLDRIHPKANEKLAERILDNGGCWISEYPPGTKVNKWMFVARDRLQSALSDIVVVIQTGLKGGTQHTVRFAREQGRRVACVVPVESDLSEQVVAGNLAMLNNQSGVIPLREPNDLEPHTGMISESGTAAESVTPQIELFSK